MTRGRYGKAAAQRRAQSAEDQLDRLLPQLHEAKRTAERYRADAEATLALRVELKHLREGYGVPVDEHERIVDQLRAEHERTVEQIIEDFDVVATCIEGRLARRRLVDEGLNAEGEEEWLNANLLRALRRLPGDCGERFLEANGVERTGRRGFLNPGVASQANVFGTQEAWSLQAMARQHGIEGGIPSEWVKGADYGRTTTNDLAELDAAYFAHLDAFPTWRRAHPINDLGYLYHLAVRRAYVRAGLSGP